MGNRKQLTDREKETLVCYKYYSGDVFSFDKPSEDELKDRRGSIFLRKPCGKGLESSITSVLEKLPICIQGNPAPNLPVISIDFQHELSCEMLTVIGLNGPEDAKAFTCCFPAGQTFNLALDAAGAKLGVKQPLLDLDEPAIRKMIAQCRKGDEADVDAVVGVIRLVRAFALPGSLMTQALMDDWLDALPFKPSSSLDGDRYLRLLGRHLQSEAKRKADERLRHVQELADSDPYFMEIAIEKNPKQIRCLMDVLYYSIRAFAMKDGKPNMRRCSSCGRVFFGSHRREVYCSFTSALPKYPKWTCQRATETTLSNYSSEIKDVKKTIEKGLRSNRRDEEIETFRNEYKAFDGELGRRSGFTERVDRYKTLIQWLSVRYLDATGEPYVSREAKNIREAIEKRLSGPDSANLRNNDAREAFLSRFDGMIKDIVDADDDDERANWCDMQVEWLSTEYARMFGEEYVPREAR